MSWKIPTSLPDLSKADIISLDIETYDPELRTRGSAVRRGGKIIGISVAVNPNTSWYFPFGHEEGNNFEEENIIKWAKDNLCRNNQPKLGANILYDLDFLYEYGVNVTGPFYDIQIAEPLIDENARSYSLDAISRKYLGESKNEILIIQEAERRGWKGKPQEHLWKMNSELVGPYAEADVELPLRVFEKQKKLLEKDDLLKLFDIETRLIPILLAMKRRGVRINVDHAEKTLVRFEKELEQQKDLLDNITGSYSEINYNAAASIADACDKMGIKYPLTEKTKVPSFTKPWLEKQGGDFFRLILNCRRLEKFIGTFMRGSILNSVINDRIHCQFNQLRSDEYGTVTGRFSSSRPNLQFIPVRDPELGPLTRSFFIPDEGEIWGRGDYSQVELRIFAHYALGIGSNQLREEYNLNPNLDLHQWCADAAGIDRKKAKTINFGILYGMGIVKLGNSLNLSREEAKGFMNKYHNKIPFVQETLWRASDRAQARGWVKTILGRKRRFNKWEPRDLNLSKEISPSRDRIRMAQKVLEAMRRRHEAGGNSIKPGVRRAGTYKALNAVIQGSAADLMKKAMVDIWEAGICNVLGAPLLTVHDELDWSIPDSKDGIDAFKESLRIMEQAVKFDIPIIVDAEMGDNWGYCREVKSW